MGAINFRLPYTYTYMHAHTQRGPIVEQVPMSQPLKFRIVYGGGALVRSGVELSSTVVGTIPVGQTIVITEKRFSNTPSYRCVPRLKLADGSGWISMRINSPPPDDIPVVELLGFAEAGEMGDFTILGPPMADGAGMLEGGYTDEEESDNSGSSASIPSANAPLLRHVSMGLRSNSMQGNGSDSSEKIARAFTDIS